MRPLFIALSLSLGYAGCAHPAQHAPGKPAQQAAPFSDSGQPVKGEYAATHAKLAAGTWAPYAAEYARANGIDLEKVQRTLFPRGTAPASNLPVSISSYQYKSGSWTFFRSASTQIYEIRKINAGTATAPLFLVLYNRLNPSAVVIDRFEAEWRLALLDDSYRLVADAVFTTRIRHRIEGMWDMIYTDLVIEEQRPVVRIMYVHTGGGGGRDQEFTFWFAGFEKPYGLILQKSDQTLDEYCGLRFLRVSRA